MKKHISIITLIVMSLVEGISVSSCEKYDEMLEVNTGYTSNVRVPDPVPMTPEDEAYVDSIKAEYDKNAK